MLLALSSIQTQVFLINNTVPQVKATDITYLDGCIHLLTDHPALCPLLIASLSTQPNTPKSYRVFGCESTLHAFHLWEPKLSQHLTICSSASSWPHAHSSWTHECSRAAVLASHLPLPWDTLIQLTLHVQLFQFLFFCPCLSRLLSTLPWKEAVLLGKWR